MSALHCRLTGPQLGMDSLAIGIDLTDSKQSKDVRVKEGKS